MLVSDMFRGGRFIDRLLIICINEVRDFRPKRLQNQNSLQLCHNGNILCLHVNIAAPPQNHLSLLDLVRVEMTGRGLYSIIPEQVV